MQRFQVVAFTDLLHYYRRYNLNGVTRTAISTFLADAEVRGSSDYIFKITNESKKRPVIVFEHQGWTSHEARLWRTLRDAVQIAGLPGALACIDADDPTNHKSLRQGHRAQMPAAYFMVRGQFDRWLDLSEPSNLASIVADFVHRAEVNYDIERVRQLLPRSHGFDMHPRSTRCLRSIGSQH
jgi:hypothetical protein